jgi:hypothetical protein
MKNELTELLRYHVTGSIERGAAEPILEVQRLPVLKGSPLWTDRHKAYQLTIKQIRAYLEKMGYDEVKRHRPTPETYGRNRWTHAKRGCRVLLAISDGDAEQIVLRSYEA